MLQRPPIAPDSFSGRILRDSLASIGAGLKEKGVEDADVRMKELAEKCGMDYAGSPYPPAGGPMLVEPYRPYGGAQSWQALDAYQEGQEWKWKYDDLSWQLRTLMDNILGDKDLSPDQVSAAIAAVAADFEGRAAAFRKREGAEPAGDEDEEADDVASVEAALAIFEDLALGERERAIVARARKALGAAAGEMTDGNYSFPNRTGASFFANSPAANVEEKKQLEAAAGLAVDAGPQDDNATDPLKATKKAQASKGLVSRLFGRKATDPNVGGGVDRAKLPKSDFVFPEDAPDGGFPIAIAGDVKDAVSSWGRYKGPRSFADFKSRLTAIAKRKGFESSLPAAWKDDNAKEYGGSFRAFKGTDGDWHWFSVYSNRYYDRENEVFPEAAHKEYIAWVDAKPADRLPDLWLWHQPIVAGKADMLDYSDGMAMAWGHFNKGFEAVAERLAAQKDLGVSHGYEYNAKAVGQDGAIWRYRTFEISPLPAARAANELTVFMPELLEETNMLTKEKRDWLAGVAGEDQVKALEAVLPKLESAAKEKGISFKEIADALATGDASAGQPATGTVPPQPASADALTLDAKGLKDLVTAAVTAGIAPLETRLKALEEADPYESLFTPRAAKAMSASRPSESDANVISGPKGGTTNQQGAKDLGLEASMREAALQMAAKEDGLPEGMPDEMKFYAAVGMFGNVRQQPGV